jgi:hypothetical protein
MTNENTRSHVRIHYPPGRRPVLTLGSAEHEVLDLSAEGLLFTLTTGAEPPQLGARLEGTVRLRASPPLAVRARVVWMDGDRVGLHFWPDAVPYPTLMAEEKSLSK